MVSPAGDLMWLDRLRHVRCNRISGCDFKATAILPPAGIELSRNGKRKTASSQADINPDINQATGIATLAGSDSGLKTLLAIWEKLNPDDRRALIEQAERLAARAAEFRGSGPGELPN